MFHNQRSSADSNSNSYCKLLLPDIVLLQRVPKSSSLLLYRKAEKMQEVKDAHTAGPRITF